VIGKLSAQRWAVDFRDFLDEIDGQGEPGLAIHVICDNLSAHRAPVVQKWLLGLPPGAALHADLLLLRSARSSGGSPNCSGAAWTAACSDHWTNSPPR